MLALMWVRGLLRRRRGRIVAASCGVAVAVALLASLGAFVSASKATMTERAVADVAVDWQVQVAPDADVSSVMASVQAANGVRAAQAVGFATTSGFEASSDGSTQTTGPGVVVGLPASYARMFSGELRPLVGAERGILLAQQTAANLHAAPGDEITIGRAGLSPATAHVDGIVELPLADSLFQTVGAPAGAQPQAPPDNVLLMPLDQWHAAFDPLAQARPDLVHTQIHVRLRHTLPHDPAAAFTAVTGRARNLEVKLAGSGLVGDNLGATLDAARSDALYAQILFLFLGLPGAVLAGLLTATVSGFGVARRRSEQALLRSRGATRRQLVALSAMEAVLVGWFGGVLGVVGALGVGRVAFGTASFGATRTAAAAWIAASVLTGFVIAGASVALPAWRDARLLTVAATRQAVGRSGASRWLRSGVDIALLAIGGIVFFLTSRGGYKLVLAPEGVPTISVNYWALAGPACLWAGAGLLAWRIADLVLTRGRAAVGGVVRPLAGGLAPTVAAAMARQHRLLARGVVLVALSTSFAASTAVFNATYRQQADVDARLTNGAAVTVTEPPGSSVGPAEAQRLGRVAGVRSVEPLQHRFAYVGADLQDIYGVRPDTIVAATKLQDAYFHGGSARQLMARLAAAPDSILVSAETVHDFQLHRGDLLRLRIQDQRSQKFVTIPFHYAGVVNEFPTAPRDSFLVANASYIARTTGNDAVGAFLVETDHAKPGTTAARVRKAVGPGARVTDLTTTRHVVGSSLTAFDLAGLTRVELAFALVLAAGSTGLVLALGIIERRRMFAIASALGTKARQIAAFVWAEAALVTGGGVIAGACMAWVLSHVLVKVLTGVFDPPPAALAVPWVYLGGVGAVAVAATVIAATGAVRGVARTTIQAIRDL
ncbi:MAG: putative transport system permease protein [Actinomycetota bacterium]|jgi:putative ABC transport system permease protein